MIDFKAVVLTILVALASKPVHSADYFVDNFDNSDSQHNWQINYNDRWCVNDRDAPYEESMWMENVTPTCFGYNAWSAQGLAGGYANGILVLNRLASNLDIPWFHYQWRGAPFHERTFPPTGDFVFETRIRIRTEGYYAAGIVVRDWPDTTPVGTNIPLVSDENTIFKVWSSYWRNNNDVDLRAVRVYLYDQFYVLDEIDLQHREFHTYRLEKTDGLYSVYMDGVLILGPVVAKNNANAILLGSPWMYKDILSSWPNIHIDYIKVTTPGPQHHTLSIRLPKTNDGSVIDSIRVTSGSGVDAVCEDIVTAICEFSFEAGSDITVSSVQTPDNVEWNKDGVLVSLPHTFKMDSDAIVIGVFDDESGCSAPLYKSVFFVDDPICKDRLLLEHWHHVGAPQAYLSNKIFKIALDRDLGILERQREVTLAVSKMASNLASTVSIVSASKKRKIRKSVAITGKTLFNSLRIFDNNAADEISKRIADIATSSGDGVGLAIRGLTDATLGIIDGLSLVNRHRAVRMAHETIVVDLLMRVHLRCTGSRKCMLDRYDANGLERFTRYGVTMAAARKSSIRTSPVSARRMDRQYRKTVRNVRRAILIK